MLNVELLAQYLTYGLIVLGILSFLVAIIVQVIKELPLLAKIPTSIVALVISLLLCPLTTVIICQIFRMVIVWYYIFASIVIAFIVYMIATGGWERISKIWRRTVYKTEIFEIDNKR